MVRFEYPLRWLYQQPRTKNPDRARFGNHSVFMAGGYLVDELGRLGVKNCVISSNLQQRARGDGFYANQRVDDAGVVVYFDLKGKGKAMACDRWDKVEHNLRALYLSVQAIRGLERWGGSEFLDGLFTGFEALPSSEDFAMSRKNYFKGITNKEELATTYRRLVKLLHPDMPGGTAKEFNIMQEQYEKIKRNIVRD